MLPRHRYPTAALIVALMTTPLSSGCPSAGYDSNEDDDDAEAEVPVLEIVSVAFSPDCTEEETGCIVGEETTVTVLVGYTGDPVDIVGVRLTSGDEQYAVLSRDLDVDPRFFSASFLNPSEGCAHWYYPDGTIEPSTRERRRLQMEATASDVIGQEAIVEGGFWLACPPGQGCTDYDPWNSGGPDYTGGFCVDD